ncbi:MAG: sulfotransferase [Acidimicrobiia bacterium]
MTGALDADRIVESAVAAAGVDDPRPERFRANLDLLVATINDEAALLPHGEVSAALTLANEQRKRIQVSHWAATCPEIAEESIDEPFFLTGLPRSGTTYFQYLFDSDPSMRMVRTWEGDAPCPPPGSDPDDAARRREAAKEAERVRKTENALSKKIAEIHLTDYDGPQECLAMLSQTFADPGAYWTYSVPTYFARLLDTVDKRSAYEHHKLVLQLLQWKRPALRWVLKWPCHLVALDEILAVYPDAKFIVTHRDPVKALASNASLAHLLRSHTSSNADKHLIGAQMKDMIGTYIERLVAFDDLHAGTGRVVHADYRQLVVDPVPVMSSVFAELGLEMSPDVQTNVASWRRENPQNKRGVHTYALEEYGLDADAIAEEWAFYIDRYGIEAEGGE